MSESGSPYPAPPTPVDPGPHLENVEPGAVLRSPNEPVVQPVTVSHTPDPATPSGDAVWPWESQQHADASGSAPAPAVQTDRLYRSAGTDHPDAASPFGEDAKASAAAAPAVGLQAAATASAAPAPSPAPAAPVSPAPIPAPVAAYSAPPQAAYMQEDEGRFGTVLAFLLIAGLTAIAGWFDMMTNAQFTWITGVVFVASCLMASLAIRRRDLWMAVIAAPLAFFVALLIAGQPSTLTGAGSLILREISLVATGLAFNAPYIFGGTAVALIVVLIRRAGFRRRDRQGS